MPDMHRERTMGDGTRVIEKFTGDPRPRELLKDELWTPVVDLQPGEVFGGFVRLAPDISVAEHPRDDADGAILELAGMRFGIPIDQLEAAIAGMQAVVESKKAKRAARKAAEAAAALEVAALAGEPADALAEGAGAPQEG